MRRPAHHLLLLVHVLVAAAAFATADAAVVTRVTLRGVTSKSTMDLVELLATKEGLPLSTPALRADCETLVAAYRAEGYYAAEAWIDTLLYASDSASVEVALGLREGPRFLVHEVRLEGASDAAIAGLRGVIRTAGGGVLDPALLELDIARILAFYARRAHPFASVGVAGVDARPDTTLEVRLRIEEGAAVTLRAVRVEGLSSTREDVVLRETRLRLPEPYDEDRVAAAAARLRRLNLFAEVREPELRMNDSGGVLLLRVSEGRTSSFDGVVGYAPAASGGGGGSVAGLVDVDVRNLAGTARAFHVHWQRDARASQEIRTRYAEPWLFSFPVTVHALFEQRQQDSTFVRRAVGGGAEYLASGSLTVGASLRHEVTIPSAGSTGLEFSRTLTAGLEIAYDSRNDRLAPSAGLWYRSEVRVGDKKTFGSSPEALAGASALRQLSVDLEWFLSLERSIVVRSALHGRQVTNRRIESGDLYRFGGTNSLRGFRELQFAGSSVAWTNLELRRLLAERSFGYVFFDTGYYALSESAGALGGPTQSVTYGYGVGLRTQTSLGSIGVSVALGQGDPFSQAKVHIGLVNEF